MLTPCLPSLPSRNSGCTSATLHSSNPTIRAKHQRHQGCQHPKSHLSLRPETHLSLRPKTHPPHTANDPTPSPPGNCRDITTEADHTPHGPQRPPIEHPGSCSSGTAPAANLVPPAFTHPQVPRRNTGTSTSLLSLPTIRLPNVDSPFASIINAPRTND